MKTEQDNQQAREDRIQETAERLLEREVLACQSSLVDSLLQHGDLDGWTLDEIVNFYPEEWGEGQDEYVETREIFEWWLVTGWLAEKLRDIGEPILDNDFGTWWGRTCTGQAILLDGTMQKVARKLHNDLEQ